ncbi:hypothetical protein M3G91_22925 [Micromonospora chalcea]|uniref:hypothetical protein n=1 Tax=Micromonospora chalcea TaxID=1874 RepID=UPI0021A27310|nr:hypothetical protein [Micromonospora chalcea]MCT2280473.1 hypothetical protein [Micromonospora chalcea]
MIAVSVARSVRGPGTDPGVIREAASGHWPYRNETDRDRLLEHADVLIAVGRGLVVGAFAVVGEPVLHEESKRVEFILDRAPAWALPLVGTPAPSELSFSRGERWPVKLFPTQEVRNRLESNDQILTLRGHHLRITATGDLIVRPAPGRSVTVTP